MARKQQIKSIIILILNFLLLSCANQLSPPGGEKDIIPPKIISSYPENGKINFSDNYIELTFSEYVNKRTINDAFFISPILENNPEFSWTNKSVEISFDEKLKENTTYSIVIGTEVADINNNNKMSEPFILTFSTGSKIDSGSISGKVFADKVDGTMIFAYSNKNDTLNIYKKKPDYVSQVNKKGEFTINGLANGIYEIFAVKDEFKNLVYDKGNDLIGYSTSSITVADSQNKIENINFFLTNEDTLAPNFQSITMTDKNHIVIEFNEPIDSSKLSSKNFVIVDSTQNLTFEIKKIFKGNPNKSEYILCVSDSLNPENNIYLIAQNILDRYKNELVNSSNSFTPSEKVDTNFIKISKLVTEYTSNTIDYQSPSFIINFSDALSDSNISNKIAFLDPDSNSISFNFIKIDDASVKIIPISDLKPKSIYKIKIDFKNIIDLAGNKVDTVMINKISTISNMEFSGVSGIVKSKSKNPKVVLNSLEKKHTKIQKEITKEGIFSFERINPGKYLMWIYNDSDSNNIYTFGNFDSLKYSEEFKFYPDTLNLRPRWPIGDIEIEF
ncbi:MAG: Ig-like domain-containing protein [Ignavibacteriae bacterium]|nr:Ig-like domain-containing protein [Ignavibacteriota bacterium]